MNAETEAKPFNPWVDILFHPRATIRKILDTDPKKHTLLLFLLASLPSSAIESLDKSDSENEIVLGKMLAIECGSSLVIGALLYFLLPHIYRITGKVFKGQGNTEEIRAAVAWGFVPFVYLHALWIPQIFILAPYFFESITQAELIELATKNLTLTFGQTAVHLVGVVWGVVVGLVTLSEAQRFSVLCSLGNYVLGVMLVLIPVFAVIFTFGAIFALN